MKVGPFYWYVECNIFHIFTLLSRAVNALFDALETCSDAVEITNENRTVQFINTAYKQQMGYTSEELLGHEMEDLPRCDKNKPELMDSIYSQLKKAKVREDIWNSDFNFVHVGLTIDNHIDDHILISSLLTRETEYGGRCFL